MGYSPWGHKESDMTQQLTHTQKRARVHTHTHTHTHTHNVKSPSKEQSFSDGSSWDKLMETMERSRRE